MDKLENIDEEEVSPASLPPKMSADSVLMDSLQLSYLTKLLKDSEIQYNNLELKYRATRDGDGQFHTICDGIPQTVMIIKAKETGQIFGGYTKNPWSSNGSYSNDATAFLFSLTKLEKIKISHPEWAIYNVAQTYSIVWGYPDDIKLYNGFLSNNSNVQVLNAYKDDSITTNESYLSEIKNFHVEELELFQLVSI